MAPIINNVVLIRVVLVLILSAGVYFFHDFLVPVLAALIICFASWPIYLRLLRHCNGNTAVAATVALLSIVAGIIVPLSLVFSFALEEVRSWITWLIEANRNGAAVPPWLEQLPLVGEWLVEQWHEHLANPGDLGHWIGIMSGQQLGGISRFVLSTSGHTIGFLLSLLFMLITLFFLYKDGLSLRTQLDTIGDRVLAARWHRFSRVVPATVSATVMGMTIIAIGEGVVLGIAYWIAGVPTPVLFGIITAFMALIPGGAPLTFTLISVYLIAIGNVTAGVGLFLWGSIELFIVDKTIRPTLVGGPIKLPFLPTFFGLIGGVKTMGLVGLFIGPVLMALLVAMWREWIHASDANQVEPQKLIDDDSTSSTIRSDSDE